MIKVVLEWISDNDYQDSVKGTAYKVFRVKYLNGDLYPPKVPNPGNQPTPTGVWLDADVGVEMGLSKTGRKKVKSTDGTLAFRPGWHLGDEPKAIQFNKDFSWEFLNDVDEQEVAGTVRTYKTFRNKCVNGKNVDKIYYIEELDKFAKIIFEEESFFPYDFVWAECEYVMDIDYNEEAHDRGYVRTNPDGSEYRSTEFDHAYAGLYKVPEKGYYKYRTNPNPETVPWVITGAIKVNRIIDDFEAAKVVKGDVPPRQGGNLTFKELEQQLGIKQVK